MTDWQIHGYTDGQIHRRTEVFLIYVDQFFEPKMCKQPCCEIIDMPWPVSYTNSFWRFFKAWRDGQIDRRTEVLLSNIDSSIWVHLKLNQSLKWDKNVYCVNVANPSRLSLTGQFSQNTDSTVMMRFKDNHSVKGRAKTLLALVLVSDFCQSTVSVLVVLWWRNLGEFWYVFGLTDAWRCQ